MGTSRSRLLFLCTGNSCRSQMAEGWARSLHGDAFEVASAGLVARGVDRRAVEVMAECGVDISRQTSTRLDDLDGAPFDYVVTVCDHAASNCPRFPARTALLHVAFDDPPALAAQAASEREALAVYRRVRDEIRAFVTALPARLPAPKA